MTEDDHPIMMECEKTESGGGDRVEVPIGELGTATPITNKSWKGVVGNRIGSSSNWNGGWLFYQKQQQQQKNKVPVAAIVVVTPSTPTTKSQNHHHHPGFHQLDIPHGCLTSPSTSDDSMIMERNDTTPTLTPTTTALSQDNIC